LLVDHLARSGRIGAASRFDRTGSLVERVAGTASR
jgi:hypothetical protein